jgi:hypothetical protein
MLVINAVTSGGQLHISYAKYHFSSAIADVMNNK